MRIPGQSEPWSTNFDVYAVPTDGSAPPRNLTASNPAWDAYPLPSRDGKKLYYEAMKRPGFEADRFAIMELDLASGTTREIDPDWDRSPGRLLLSPDGRTLYTTADDNGEHPLFAIDIASGHVKQDRRRRQRRRFLGRRSAPHLRARFAEVTDAAVCAGRRWPLRSSSPISTTRASRTWCSATSSRFEFKGWNGDTVHGYVMKPYGFEAGTQVSGRLPDPWRTARLMGE